MANRYRLFRRKGTFYLHDGETGKQESLRTKDKKEANRVFQAKQEAQLLPSINRQIARAYLHAADPEYIKRTWTEVCEAIIATKTGDTRKRWETAWKDRALLILRKIVVTETTAEQFLKILNTGTVSTNVYLRRLHNFALDMSWLLSPVIPCRVWPGVNYAVKRAITPEEHQRILEAERNAERRNYYQLCWYTGASQGDVAKLRSTDIDWVNKAITLVRQKVRKNGSGFSQINFSDSFEGILNELPRTGPLFPNLIRVQSKDRANEFRQRCALLHIKGVTLHSYRYSWAERAKQAGFPERWAMAVLGHSSKAIHESYGKGAVMKIPALDVFESEHKQRPRNVVPMPPLDEPISDDKSKIAEGV